MINKGGVELNAFTAGSKRRIRQEISQLQSRLEYTGATYEHECRTGQSGLSQDLEQQISPQAKVGVGNQIWGSNRFEPGRTSNMVS